MLMIVCWRLIYSLESIFRCAVHSLLEICNGRSWRIFFCFFVLFCNPRASFQGRSKKVKIPSNINLWLILYCKIFIMVYFSEKMKKGFHHDIPHSHGWWMEFKRPLIRNVFDQSGILVIFWPLPVEINSYKL